MKDHKTTISWGQTFVENVEKQKFYHIQRNKKWGSEDNWIKGTELTIGNKHNKYMSSRYNDNYHMPFDLNLRGYLNKGITDIEIKNIEIVWKEFIIKTREYIFEVERLRINPELPSRFRCLFLTDYDGLTMWQNKLGASTDFSIYLLETTGRIHKANENFLKLNTNSQKHHHELARRYWLGEDADLPGSEYLFEGDIKVIEVVK